MGEPASAWSLADRAATLRDLALSLRSAFDQPAMKSRVDEASSNLGIAARWLSDPSLASSHDGLLWVDLLLTIAARRLEALRGDVER